MKPCCSLINIFSGRAALLRRQNFSTMAERQLGPTVIWATKKPRLMARRGDKAFVLLLIFPKLMMLELELAPDIETKVQPVAVASSGQSLDHSS
jgi:hypothetical protein